MANELGEVRVIVNEVEQARPETAVERPAQEPDHDLSTQQHQRDVDAVFAEEQREAKEAAGWLGMWAGSLMRRDGSAAAAAESDEDENERKKKLKAKPYDGDCC